MENQPTAAVASRRQWFRLASIARLEALGQSPSLGPTPPANPAPAAPFPDPVPVPVLGTTAPAPNPAPRIPLPLQAHPQPQPPITANGAQSSQGETPPRPPTMNPSQSAPPPPSPRLRIPSRGPTPPESPKIIKQSSTTPPESPKIQQLKPVKAPPPPYPEPEPTTVPAPSPKWNSSGSNNGTMVHKAVADINGKPPPPSSPNRNVAHNGTGMTKRDDDGEMKMITMAGENTGAYMELLGSNRKQKNGNHLLKHQTQNNTTQNNTEDGTLEANKKEGKAMGTVVNGNVQSVNNSILFGSSCTQQSPGVHIAFVSRRKPKHKGAT